MSQTRRGERKFKKGGLIVILLVLIVIVAGAIYGLSVLSQDGYTSEESFQEYASSYFNEIDGKKQVGTSKEDIKYGDPLSFAIQSPTLDKEEMTASVDGIIEKETKQFETSKVSLPPGGKSALLMGYESYKTPEKVTGIALHRTVREEDVDGKVKIMTKVIPFNFLTKSGISLSPIQIFSGDYKPIYEKEVKTQLEKQHGKHLKKEADSVIADNAEHFVMTDKGFKFYYNSGTLLPEEDGIATVEIPYDSFQSVMRDDIGARVIDPSKPMIALTYDDGPHGTLTPELLDIFEKNNAVCTFFELGSNVDHVKNSSDSLKRMLQLGCEIGSHSYSHPDLHTLSSEAVKGEADKASKAIEKASGKAPTVFRPPYGKGSPSIAKVFNLPSINWTVDTLDWRSKDKNKILAHVTGYPNLDGQIVLMHSIHQASIDASKEMVPWLISKGYQLVTVSELFQYKYGGPPEKGVDYGYHPDQPKR